MENKKEFEEALDLLYKEPRCDKFKTQAILKLRKICRPRHVLEVFECFESGLTKDEIKLCFSFDFTREQICCIRYFFNGLHERKLSIAQARIFARPEFTPDQMRIIGTGLYYLSSEQVSLFAKPEFDWNQMWSIYLGFKEHKLSLEQVSFYANPKYTCQTMNFIREAFVNGLSLEQIEMFLNPAFDYQQREQIRDGLVSGLSVEDVLFYAKPQFTAWQMLEIKGGFQHGLTHEQIALYADPKFDGVQMGQIRISIEEHYPMDIILKLTDEHLSFEQMELIRKASVREIC